MNHNCIDNIHCDGNCSSKIGYSNKGRRIAMPKLVKSHSEIRDQYLRKLGVVRALSQIATSTNCRNHQPHQMKVRPAPFTYRKILEIDGLAEKEVFKSQSPNDIMNFDQHSAFPPKRPSVTFDVTVRVKVIPNKDMFSKSVKKVLWNSPEELDLNARRNFVEFESEGCDWHNAIEDDHFVTCPKTGAQIHPVHLHWLDHVMARRR